MSLFDVIKYSVHEKSSIRDFNKIPKELYYRVITHPDYVNGIDELSNDHRFPENIKLLNRILLENEDEFV